MAARRASIITIVGVMLAAGTSPASACSVVAPKSWGTREFRAAARTTLDGATAIIDGEVIRPFIPGKQNALVRAHKVLWGPQAKEFEVGELNSCSIALDRLGERSRMLLIGGPAVYFLQEDQSNSLYEDELLGSDRRTDWPFRQGD